MKTLNCDTPLMETTLQPSSQKGRKNTQLGQHNALLIASPIVISPPPQLLLTVHQITRNEKSSFAPAQSVWCSRGLHRPLHSYLMTTIIFLFPFFFFSFQVRVVNCCHPFPPIQGTRFVWFVCLPFVLFGSTDWLLSTSLISVFLFAVWLQSIFSWIFIVTLIFYNCYMAIRVNWLIQKKNYQ